MKQKMFFLCVILFSAVYMRAQVMVNGDFSINSGNVPLANCQGFGSAPTINGVSNWNPTFGTPNFGGSGAATGGSGAFPNFIFLFSAQGLGSSGTVTLGEGINGGYPFQAGVTYQIHICAAELESPSHIRVVAGTNASLPVSSGCDIITCGKFSGGSFGQALCPFPATIPSGSTTMQEIPHPDFVLNTDNGFLFTPNNNYDWIEIFPYSNDACEAFITVKYCWVYPMCWNTYNIPGSVPSLSVNPLIPSTYTAAGIINVSDPSSPVSVSTSGNTIFDAGQEIDISNNFIAAPTNGYFLAQIYNTSCSIPSLKLCDGPASRSMDQPSVSDPDEVAANMLKGNNVQKRLTTNEPNITLAENIEVSIFPNPTDGSVSVNYPCNNAGRVTIKISDVRGQVMYNEAFDCANEGSAQQTVDMTRFRPGLYFVDVTLNDSHTIKKVMKL